jgi:L-aspartate oxidase
MPVVPAAHYYMGGIAVDEWGRASLPGLWACGEASATGVHGANRLASNSLLEALVFGARAAEAIAAGPERARAAAAPAAAVRLEVGARDLTADPIAAAGELRRKIRNLAWERLGLVRDRAGLVAAQLEFADLFARLPRGACEVRNLAIAGSLVAAAALRRTESRGAHFRSDFPETSEAWRFRQFATATVTAGGVAVDFAPTAIGQGGMRAAAIA